MRNILEWNDVKEGENDRGERREMEEKGSHCENVRFQRILVQRAGLHEIASSLS